MLAPRISIPTRIDALTEAGELADAERACAATLAAAPRAKVRLVLPLAWLPAVTAVIITPHRKVATPTARPPPNQADLARAPEDSGCSP